MASIVRCFRYDLCVLFILYSESAEIPCLKRKFVHRSNKIRNQRQSSKNQNRSFLHKGRPKYEYKFCDVFFFSKRLLVSEKIEKIRAHIRVRFRESKMAEIPPCSLDSQIKTSQLGEALILPICCITRLCLNTVISKALDYSTFKRKLKSRGLFFVP